MTAPDPQPAGHDADRGLHLLLLVAVLAMLVGGIFVYRTLAADGGGPPRPPASATRPQAAAPPGEQPAGQPLEQPVVQPAGQPADQARVQPPDAAVPLPAARPLRVVIPKIAVDAPLVGLSLDASRELAVPDPDARNLAGWYQDGVAPGARGTSVVVAHVDTRSGPAAFFGLGTLRPGDTAEIVRADGLVATFRVDSVEVFDKKGFPSDRVYANAPDAQLRLITCGGAYDKGSGGYQANVVAFATLVAARNT